VNIVFFGTGDFGIASLEALKKSSHNLLGVVTAPDKPQGRHLEIKPSPIKAWAVQNKIPVFEFANVNSQDALQTLKELNADVFVVIAFGMILSKAFLEIPRLTTLNTHSSLLPRWRGAAPVAWALIESDAETGVTISRVVQKLDAGDILLQKKTPITPEDDLESINARLSVLGAGILLEGLELLEKGKAAWTPQDETRSCYARKLTKEDGHINWSLKAAQIHSHIRATKHWPGAYFFYGGKRILIQKITLLDQTLSNHAPGTIVKASQKEGIVIATGEGLIRVEVLQLEGKKPLSAADFLNGFSLTEGQLLQ
jgi:methionyl-tRNA formyltransferase